MTQEPQPRQPEDFDPFAGPLEQSRAWHHNRREKIVQEIIANRRGEYVVPTWVLGVCLAAMIVVILAFLIFA